METVTVLMIGDVVGNTGMALVKERLPPLIRERGALFTVVNGENAAGGYGLTPPLACEIFASGADVITSGNHIWEKRDFWPYMESAERLLRPANYPPGAPGRGAVFVRKGGVLFAVINLQGRKYMSAIDCPFRCFDTVYGTAAAGGAAGAGGGMAADAGGGMAAGAADAGGGGAADAGETPCRPVILVDFHAESSEEKEALGLYVDGRAAVCAGTHTHVQTADEKILPRGTAYITDLGMTGARRAVIGMKPEGCVTRFVSHIQTRMECASEDPALQGIAVRVNPSTGLAEEIFRIEKPL